MGAGREGELAALLKRPDGLIAPVPDLYAGEERAILLELSLPALAEGRQALGSFTLECEEAGRGGGRVRLESDLSVAVTEDEDLLFSEQEHPDVLRAREVHQAAQAVEEAVRLADEGRLDDATFCLNAQYDHLRALSLTAQDPELGKVMEELKQRAERLSAAGYDQASRKELV